MAWLIVILYFICLLVIFGYALLQFSLTVNYVSSKKKKSRNPIPELSTYPLVTVQLPVFNEKYVIERLIDSVAELDYPKEKLEIQVLDDSLDETTALAAEKIRMLKDAGINIALIRREKREGFKAGALDYGLKSAKGEFIAIFDADFIPEPDFLKKTLPHFQDPGVGVVQTRWEHINRDCSLLTKLQAFGLDAHFSIEQVGRNAKDHFINFNGTAGIWRKETIYDAGGWQHDTLTEDLDLSYRSQLKGWKFVYREDILSPAELPVAISALKTQQFRWIKGGAENFVKMSGPLVKTKKIRFSDRIHGLGHLFNSTVYLFVFLAALLTIPLIYAASNEPLISTILRWMAFFFSSTILLMVFYWVSFREETNSRWLKLPLFIWRFFQYLTVSLGLSYYNTRGIVQAYSGKKTAFIRTPKFNVSGKGEWRKNVYLIKGIGLTTIIEGLLSLYFIAGIVLSYFSGFYGMIPFQTMLALGFGLIFIFTIKERKG